MNPRNFFAELKRRNVYKVAVAYAVVALAADSARVDFVPDLRSAGVGHEGRLSRWSRSGFRWR